MQKKDIFLARVYLSQPLAGNISIFFFSFLKDSPYQYVHCAGKGQDENPAKWSDEVFLVGEGGGEETVEGDAARVGDGHGEQAQNPIPHPSASDPLLTTLLFRIWFFSEK